MSQSSSNQSTQSDISASDVSTDYQGEDRRELLEHMQSSDVYMDHIQSTQVSHIQTNDGCDITDPNNLIDPNKLTDPNLRPYSKIFQTEENGHTSPSHEPTCQNLMPLLSVDNSVTDDVDQNVGYSAKHIYERASTDDKMIVLFAILIGSTDVQRNMTNTYRELNLKVPQNVRIGPLKNHGV